MFAHRPPFFVFFFCSLALFCLAEQEEVFLYGEEISVDATEKPDEVRLFGHFHASSFDTCAAGYELHNDMFCQFSGGVALFFTVGNPRCRARLPVGFVLSWKW